MITSLLAFLTLLEKRVQPLLPEGKAWRFQRLINFGAHEATLQLWEGDALTGHAELRESRQSDGAASFSGTVLSVVDPPGAPRAFSFRPATSEEVERHAQQIAELWRQTLPG